MEHFQVSVSSYLGELRAVRHRLAQLIAEVDSTLVDVEHQETLIWAHQIISDLVEDVEDASKVIEISRAAQERANS